MCLLLLWLLLPSPAWACPTCGTATMPGLGAATELIGAYPDRRFRSPAERFPLEGAADRAGRLAGVVGRRTPLLSVLAGRPPLEAPTILAGFTLRGRVANLHVCGPELTLELRY